MLNGPCVITICQTQQSARWKKVTEFVIAKGQNNNTLPRYLQIGDIICLNCYNGIVVNCSFEFQQHALESSVPPPVPPALPLQLPPPPPLPLLIQSTPPPPSIF